MKIKCIDNRGSPWFEVGKMYKAWMDAEGDVWSDSDMGYSVCHGTLSLSAHGTFELLEEYKSHPHADLMLKYAMIAQYDDKPWESFEFRNGNTDGWMRVINPCWDIDNEYRLKPQEPKIQVGQTWVSKEGVEVVINVQSNKDTVVFMFDVGGMTHRQLCNFDNFLQNFKLKENK